MLSEKKSPEDTKPIDACDAVGVDDVEFAGGKLRADRRIVGVTVLGVFLFLVDVALVVAGFLSGGLS
ncbi:hypothetical protein [Microbacterium sp. KR10-403]|uniref:hypothetical protein n=1 Tax=Microbacterium sp. KR10-403 TaxID=3158581 RepID=UPI0032E4B957